MIKGARREDEEGSALAIMESQQRRMSSHRSHRLSLGMCLVPPKPSSDTLANSGDQETVLVPSPAPVSQPPPPAQPDKSAEEDGK